MQIFIDSRRWFFNMNNYTFGIFIIHYNIFCNRTLGATHTWLFPKSVTILKICRHTKWGVVSHKVWKYNLVGPSKRAKEIYLIVLEIRDLAKDHGISSATCVWHISTDQTFLKFEKKDSKLKMKNLKLVWSARFHKQEIYTMEWR